MLTDSISTAGGAEKLAAEIILRLDPARFDRTICATRTYADDLYLDAFRDAGVHVMRLERHKKWEIAAWLPLLRELRVTDVVHAHKFGSNVWGVLWGRLARVPVIVAHEHTWSYEGQPLRRFLDRELIARGASVFVVVSREDQRRAHTIEGIDPSRILCMPNGVPALHASGKNVRLELGIREGAPVIGTISVLRPQKGLDVLLRAAADLKHAFPGLHVLIAGRGAEQGRLESLIRELDLAETVHLLGRRQDVADVVAALDVAVLSSDFEGSPLSVMEYMSAGKAIVATSVGGVPDLIEDGVHGLLVDRRDHGGLATAIASLLNDPARREQLGQNALARHRREFDIDQAVRRFEHLYDTLYTNREFTAAAAAMPQLPLSQNALLR